MAILVVYDSAYGNTSKVAHAIGDGLSGSTEVRQLKELDPRHLPSFELMIVGCPTQGGRPTGAMTAWLEALPVAVIAGKKVAVFDTRLASTEQNGFLRLLMSMIGYAAPKLERTLRHKGADIIGSPKGFIVTGREGPLQSGELERAEAWGKAAAAEAQLFEMAP